MRTLSPWVLLAFGFFGWSTQVFAESRPVEGEGQAEDLVAPEDADHELAGSEDADQDADALAEDMHADDATAAEEEPACDVEPVTLRRFGLVGDPVIVRLTDCAGAPNLEAVAPLRELVQPIAQKPAADPSAEDSDPKEAGSAEASADASAEVLLNPELLVRIQRLVDHFEKRSVEIVSGYRPTARAGSRHHSGDALDLRIDGIDNLALSEFARTLDATGVGYYPNSTFVHVDVREAPAYWVDRSRPGERPKYARKAAAAAVVVPAEVAPAEAAAIDKALAAEPAAKVPASSSAKTEPSAAEADDRLRETRMVDVPSKTAETEISGEAPSRVEAEDPRLDPDVRAVMDRALAVMNQELGIDGTATPEAGKKTRLRTHDAEE
jgi:hypothetical protein